MENKNKKNQQGFIALMTVIIISAVLLVMMVTAAGIAFRGRFNVLDYENKKISVGLAEACARTAMLKIAQGSVTPSTGVVDEEVVIEADKTCKICIVDGTDPDYTIETRAAYKGTYTNLVVTAKLEDDEFTINSWDEEANSDYADECQP